MRSSNWLKYEGCGYWMGWKTSGHDEQDAVWFTQSIGYKCSRKDTQSRVSVPPCLVISISQSVHKPTTVTKQGISCLLFHYRCKMGRYGWLDSRKNFGNTFSGRKFSDLASLPLPNAPHHRFSFHFYTSASPYYFFLPSSEALSGDGTVEGRDWESGARVDSAGAARLRYCSGWCTTGRMRSATSPSGNMSSRDRPLNRS